MRYDTGLYVVYSFMFKYVSWFESPVCNPARLAHISHVSQIYIIYQNTKSNASNQIIIKLKI